MKSEILQERTGNMDELKGKKAFLFDLDGDRKSVV